MTPWDTITCRGFSPLWNCFWDMVFSTARWEGRDGLKQNAEWKGNSFGFYQQTFQPWCAFHTFCCSTRTGDPIHWWKSMSVCAPPSPKAVRECGRVNLGVQSSSGRKLPVAVAWGQWGANASVLDSAFVSSSPPFMSSSSFPLLPAPAKGKPSFILPLASVYIAMATLCLQLRHIERKSHLIR